MSSVKKIYYYSHVEVTDGNAIYFRTGSLSQTLPGICVRSLMPDCSCVRHKSGNESFKMRNWNFVTML